MRHEREIKALVERWLEPGTKEHERYFLQGLVRAGIDPRLMKKARNSRDDYEERNAESVLRAYEFFRRFNSGDVGRVNLRAVLRRTAKKGGNVSLKHLAYYGMVPMIPEGDKIKEWEQRWGRIQNEEGGDEYCVYLDAPFGFGLMYRGFPNAVVSFNFPDWRTIMIYQLQPIMPYKMNQEGKTVIDHGGPVRENPWGLALFDHFEDPLLFYTETWASQNGFGLVGINPAIMNPWTEIDAPESIGYVHLSPERARQIYDGTAKRLGYKRDADWLWSKRLR